MKPWTGTVVIPAAMPVTSAVAADFGNISPIRLPAGNSSVGALLWQTYRRYTSDIRFVLSGAEEHVVQAGGVFGLPNDVATYKADDSSSLADSILTAFANHPPRGNAIVVNFGDTLVPRPMTGEDRVLVARDRPLVRWTTFGQSESGSWHIFEKDCMKPDMAAHWIVAGVFELSDGQAFLEYLRELRCERESGLDPFYVAIKAYLERDKAVDQRIFEDCTSTWLDFGHIDSLHASRLSLGGTSRSFNAVSVDIQRGLMTKRSIRSHDFAAERQWYFSLPDSLRHIAPRVLSSDTDEHLTLEYYGYPSLQELYLYSSLDLGDWELVLGKIGEALEALRQVVPPSPPAQDVLAEARMEMYLVKTQSRMEEAFKDSSLTPVFDVSTINGISCPSGREILTQLPDTLRSAGLLEPSRFSVIHGDFCLSNILYDRRSSILRLIDPRGQFGSIRLYGDPLYDEAKLAHSFHGHYDFLVHEQMSLSLSHDSAELRVPVSAVQRKIRELFNVWQRSRRGVEAPAIQLLESLLFLSMVPLHADRPTAQAAFILRGRELFAEAMEVAS